MDAAERAYLSSYWWVLTVRGIASLLFGIAAVFWPGITLTVLIYIFSAFILVSGISSLIGGIMSIGHRRGWIFSVVLGLLEIGVGIYLIRHPLVSLKTVILLIAFVFIIRGVMELVATFADEDPKQSRWLMLGAGALYTLAGIVMLFQPVASGLAFVWILGVVSLISGPLMIALSVQVKHMGEPKKALKA